MVEPLRLHAPSRRNAVVVELPVVLAPMAGITNAAYRALCLEQGAGLYVCEMLTSRGIIAGDHKTHSMLAFDPSETSVRCSSTAWTQKPWRMRQNS